MENSKSSNNKNPNKHGVWQYVVMFVLALGVIVLGWMLVEEKAVAPTGNGNDVETITNFDECEAAGYPIGESYPRQCFGPNGQTFVEDIDQNGADEPQTTTFTSPKGVKIELDNFASGQTITSPFTLKGRVPGNWSFEASFPVVLTNWDGLIIAQEPAQLTGDWMTTELVPFEVTLTFEKPEAYNNGSLILQKDNPSGLPENDDAIEIPINY